MNRDAYRHALAALLTDADRLGSTPDELAARALVLAELRHAIAVGLVEEPAPVEQPSSGGDGWIPWAGGKCPCPDWPEVEYKLRDGYSDTLPPGRMGWEHRYGQGDIIAYRRPLP